MTTIRADQIEQVAYTLLCHASIELPPDVERALRKAWEKEANPTGKAYFKAILDNLGIARRDRVPLCQDTGVPMYYVTLGSAVSVEGHLRQAFVNATSRATADTPLRQQVTNPLTNENPGTNVGWQMPPVFFDYLDGADYVEILAVPKGGGAELKWSCVVPIPGAPKEETILKTVIDAVSMPGGEPCTPTIVGVAVGGFGLDYTEQLARKAIYRTPLNSRNPDPKVAALEDKLYTALNQLGIGPLGVGGETTCLAVHMEIAGTHSAVFPIAVAFYCWASRYSRARIHGSGEVEYLTHPHLGER
ncbi:MAG: fumarate hydratase [Chloroflexi bacterium]|nr:fumarate hydratase [Chloroflexota bacterium]